jgi:hypothetical protein
MRRSSVNITRIIRQVIENPLDDIARMRLMRELEQPLQLRISRCYGYSLLNIFFNQLKT